MSKKCCDDGSIEAGPGCAGVAVQTCTTVPARNVCTSCSCSPCRCASSCSPCGTQVKPFYQQVSMCPEDNKKTILVERLVGAFKTIAGFSMPACGAKVWVFFDRVGDVPIGAWMWAFGIGILEITGFNPLTGEIELKNNCPESPCAGQVQAPPGTPIPRCTVFMLMAPTCSGATSNPNVTFPYLNAGFTAPADGDCIDITVTNVNGLIVGKNVTINSGTYRISAILSATLITICNDGAGLTPGTVVEYKDAAGNLIVPIVLIDSNPCTSPLIEDGKVLVCKNNIIQPLTGKFTGQILVLTDPDTGTAVYKTLGIPTVECTELTVCLTLDPDLPPDTPYVISVVSTAAFTAGDIVLIAGQPFTVDVILSATQMRVIPVNPPVVIETFNVGTPVCAADCCQILNDRLDDLVGEIQPWTPVVTLNGGATISAATFSTAIWSVVGPWIEFKIHAAFTVSGAGGGSNLYSITEPAPGVTEVGDPYLCHVDDNNAYLATGAFWRKSSASNLIVFQSGNAAFTNGAGRIAIDGKYWKA